MPAKKIVGLSLCWTNLCLCCGKCKVLMIISKSDMIRDGVLVVDDIVFRTFDNICDQIYYLVNINQGTALGIAS